MKNYLKRFSYLLILVTPLCAMEKDQKPQISQLEKKFIHAAIDGDVKLFKDCIDEKVDNR